MYIKRTFYLFSNVLKYYLYCIKSPPLVSPFLFLKDFFSCNVTISGLINIFSTLYLLFHWPNILFLPNSFEVTKSNILFSIKSNILLSSIPVVQERVSFQNGYIRKWDIQKIGYNKKNERKNVLRMWSSAKWHHLKQNENEIRWSKRCHYVCTTREHNTYFESQFSLRQHIFITFAL